MALAKFLTKEKYRHTLAFLAVFLLLSGIVSSQRVYDLIKLESPAIDFPPSTPIIKALDLGLHSAAASFLWFKIRLELPPLYKGLQRYLSYIETINDLDFRFSTPYLVSVVVLPDHRFPDRVSAAVRIGKKGIIYADSDWRLPFYLAATYVLYLDDVKNGVKYFDLAAMAPGIPEHVRRFAVNYGVHPSKRKAVKEAWKITYETATDESVRERAKKYVEHYEIVDFLQSAVDLYTKIYGKYPEVLEDLTGTGIIKEIPVSPLGFEYKIYKKGIVGIKPAEESIR